jgi:hypothetical protein
MMAKRLEQRRPGQPHGPGGEWSGTLLWVFDVGICGWELGPAWPSYPSDALAMTNIRPA